MYATLLEARAEGITEAQADDPRLTTLLERASEAIDRYTGWWFESRTLALTFDGSGTRNLHLPAPCIALTRVAVDGSDLSLVDDVLNLGAPSGLGSKRFNPKLMRAGGITWPRGTQNLRVEGRLGFVEADESVPPAIRDVCIRLAVRELARFADVAAQEERRQRTMLTKEQTDGHSYELGQGDIGKRAAWRLGGFTGDPEIDIVLARFRRPPAGGVP